MYIDDPKSVQAEMNRVMREEKERIAIEIAIKKERLAQERRDAADRRRAEADARREIAEERREKAQKAREAAINKEIEVIYNLTCDYLNIIFRSSSPNMLIRKEIKIIDIINYIRNEGFLDDNDKKIYLVIEDLLKNHINGISLGSNHSSFTLTIYKGNSEKAREKFLINLKEFCIKYVKNKININDEILNHIASNFLNIYGGNTFSGGNYKTYLPLIIYGNIFDPNNNFVRRYDIKEYIFDFLDKEIIAEEKRKELFLQKCKEEEHKRNIILLKNKAENGDISSLIKLGNMYESGEDREIQKNYLTAINLYKRAVEQGSIEAQFYLAEMYKNGRGEAQDCQKAFKLYKKPVAQGYSGAQMSLADMYQKGMGIPLNLKKALALYEKAADQGNIEAKKKVKEITIIRRNIRKRLIKYTILFFVTMVLPTILLLHYFA